MTENTDTIAIFILKIQPGLNNQLDLDQFAPEEAV